MTTKERKKLHYEMWDEIAKSGKKPKNDAQHGCWMCDEDLQHNDDCRHCPSGSPMFCSNGLHSMWMKCPSKELAERIRDSWK